MFLTLNLSKFTPVNVLWGIAAVCPPADMCENTLGSVGLVHVGINLK